MTLWPPTGLVSIHVCCPSDELVSMRREVDLAGDVVVDLDLEGCRGEAELIGRIVERFRIAKPIRHPDALVSVLPEMESLWPERGHLVIVDMEGLAAEDQTWLADLLPQIADRRRSTGHAFVVCLLDVVDPHGLAMVMDLQNAVLEASGRAYPPGGERSVDLVLHEGRLA